jgi:dethiobiotin synthetase
MAVLQLDGPAAGKHDPPMSFFVTGTDTGVGKTHVTRLILEGLRGAGVDAAGYKPVACGDRDDARILAEASGGLALEQVNPVFLKSPVAPYVAGLLENRTIDPAEMLAGYRRLAAAHQTVVVEGAGGWEVPVAAGYRISDLAAELGLPVVLVAANRLGALNHILLTLGAIRARGLSCAGIFLNQLDDELDTAMITNKGLVEELTGVPLLEHLIHGQDFLDPEVLSRLPA